VRALASSAQLTCRATAIPQVYGVSDASGVPAGAPATAPQLQRLRTLRGHAGRVRSLVWAGRSGGDAAASGESAAEAAGSNRGDSEPAVTLLSGCEDQTVRAWTVDPDQRPPAAPDAATAAAPASQTSALVFATAATASDTAEESSLQPPPPQPPLPQRQQPGMLRPPSLADGMEAAGGADNASSAAAARQQPPAPQRLDSSHREGSASGELHTLAAVAAASPGHLRFGGLPPELPSPTRTQSAAWAPPAVPHVTASAVSAVSAAQAAPSGPRAAVDAEVAATRSATLPALQPFAQTQHGSTRAAPAAGAVAGASAALPPAGKRSRQQKAPSLGARLLLPTAAGLGSQTAAEPDAAAQAAALQTCLQLSARLYGSSEGGAAGGRGSDAARRQGGAHPAAPAGSGIFESPLEAAAALLAAASQLQQVDAPQLQLSCTLATAAAFEPLQHCSRQHPIHSLTPRHASMSSVFHGNVLDAGRRRDACRGTPSSGAAAVGGRRDRRTAHRPCRRRADCGFRQHVGRSRWGRCRQCA